MQILLGGKVIYEGCQAAAELERMGYVAGKEGGMGTIACRTLVTKEKR